MMYYYNNPIMIIDLYGNPLATQLCQNSRLHFVDCMLVFKIYTAGLS